MQGNDERDNPYGGAEFHRVDESRLRTMIDRLHPTHFAISLKNRIKAFALSVGVGALMSMAPDQHAASMTIDQAEAATRPPEIGRVTDVQAPESPVEAKSKQPVLTPEGSYRIFTGKAYPQDGKEPGEPERQVTPEMIKGWVELGAARRLNPNIDRRFSDHFRDPRIKEPELSDEDVQRTVKDLWDRNPGYMQELLDNSQNYLDTLSQQYHLNAKNGDAMRPLFLGRFNDEFIIRIIARLEREKGAPETSKSRKNFEKGRLEVIPARFDYTDRADYQEKMNSTDPEKRGYSVRGLVEAEIAGLLNKNLGTRRSRNALRSTYSGGLSNTALPEDDKELNDTLIKAKERWDRIFGSGTYDDVVDAFAARQRNTMLLSNPGRDVVDGDKITNGEVWGWHANPGDLMDVFCFKEGYEGFRGLTSTQFEVKDFRGRTQRYKQLVAEVWGD